MMTTILTDIEGTTSSISFVRDVLFPYARRVLPDFVRRHRDDPEVRRWLDLAALDIGGVSSDDCIVEVLQQWIDQDRKHTALKGLQGILWRDGYAAGNYRAHVYPDAAAKLSEWHAAGIAIHVYSSGSVEAQQLFFAHTEAGDLQPYFRGYFDTTIGGKREAASYRNIVERLAVPAATVLFLSDVVEELDAARDAGVGTVLVDRLEDYPQPRSGDAAHGHRRVTGFDQIELEAELRG